MVLSLAFSHDGQRLASGSMYEFVRLFRVADGAPLDATRFQVEGSGPFRIHSLCFSPDARILASTSFEWLATFDATSLSTPRGTQIPGTALGMRQTLSGAVAVASDDGLVRMIDTASGKATKLLVGHLGPARALCLTSDERLVYSVGEDGTLRRWRTDFALHELTRRAAAPGSPCLAVSKSRNYLAVAGEAGEIQLWDTRTSRQTASWTGHQGTVNALTFAPDDSSLVSVSKDGTAKVWNGREGRLLATVFETTNWLEAAEFTSDGQSLFVGGRDGLIRRFHAQDWSLQATYTGHEDRVWGLAVSPDGRWLASASRDHSFRLWDIAKGQAVWKESFREPIGAVAFSPDARTLAVSTSRSTTVSSFAGEIEF